jgi:hypothetical protein
MKMVSNADLIGGTITWVGWSTLTVQASDGRTLEVNIEIGHSGPELNAYEMGKPKKEKLPDDAPTDEDQSVAGRPRSA